MIFFLVTLTGINGFLLLLIFFDLLGHSQIACPIKRHQIYFYLYFARLLPRSSARGVCFLKIAGKNNKNNEKEIEKWIELFSRDGILLSTASCLPRTPRGEQRRFRSGSQGVSPSTSRSAVQFRSILKERSP